MTASPPSCRRRCGSRPTGGCNSPTVYSHELDRILARVFALVTEEQFAAVQEYIDTLRAFAARQDSGPALAQVEQEMAALGKRKDKLLDLVLAGALSNEDFKQRNEVALEERRSSLQNAEQTLAERIRRVENLRRTIEEQWQANCGFSREMSKALVSRIVVDADENKTCISLDVFLTAGRESCTDPVLPAASQASDAPLKMTFPRPRSGH
jgi:site-specific DNA recombinase